MKKHDLQQFGELFANLAAMRELHAEQDKKMQELQDAILSEQKDEIIQRLSARKVLRGHYYGKPEEPRTLLITRVSIYSQLLSIKPSQGNEIPLLIEGIWDVPWAKRNLGGWPHMSQRAFVISFEEIFADDDTSKTAF